MTGCTKRVNRIHISCKKTRDMHGDILTKKVTLCIIIIKKTLHWQYVWI